MTVGAEVVMGRLKEQLGCQRIGADLMDNPEWS